MRMCSREQEDAQAEATRDEMRAMFDDTPNPPRRKAVVPRTLPKDWMPIDPSSYDLEGWDEILERSRINRARLARKRGLK